MGRIVIPRPTRRATGRRASLRAPEKYGYFSRGFGPQEMSLVSKLADLAVAGGGQIARAVQISNREEEQAEAQAEYDRKLQSEIESRQRAAQAEIAGTDIDGQVEAFFAQQDPPSVRERLPSMSDMSLQGTLVQPRPMQRGGVSPGVLARPGLLAPEDLSMARAQMARKLQADAMPSLRQRSDIAAADVLNRALLVPGDPTHKGYIDPEGMPVTSIAESEGLMRAAESQELERLKRQSVQDSVRAARSLPPSKQITGAQAARVLLDERGNLSALARNLGLSEQMVQDLIGSTGFEMPDAAGRAAALGADPSLTYRPQTVGAADPYDAAQRRAELQQAMQGRDFRQEAIEAIGPAPEAKLFRIADILAAAPSARTAEQRAMLLQAAVDSPDIQAANLSDWAKGAYRDRAMKTVMGLFPKEEEPMSELDMLRMQSMRESMETENLRQQKLQAALDKEAADLVRQAERLKGGNARAKKMGALVDQSVFFLQNYKARSEGDMDDATWSAGAGQFAGDRPESIVAHAQRLKLPRRSIAAIRGGAPMLLRRAPTDPPPPGVLMSRGEMRLRQNSIVKHDKDEAEASGNVRKLQGYLTKTPRELKALNLTRDGIESEIEVQKKLAGIAKSAAKSDRDALKADREAREQGAASAPSGAVYTAPITDEDLKFVESVRQKHGQQN